MSSDDGKIWKKRIECKKTFSRQMQRTCQELMHDLKLQSEGVSESFRAQVHLNGRLQENSDLDSWPRPPIPCTRSSLESERHRCSNPHFLLEKQKVGP